MSRKPALLFFFALAGCTLVQPPVGPPPGQTSSSSGAQSGSGGSGSGGSGTTGSAGSSSSGQGSSGTSGGSSGTTGQGSSGTSGGSSGSTGQGSSGTSGGSSGSTGQGSSGTTGGSSGTTGSSGGGVDGGCSGGGVDGGCPVAPTGALRVLATDDVQAGGIWDITNGDGGMAIGGGNWSSSSPLAVAIDATHGQILVLTDADGLYAFKSDDGSFLGNVSLPWGDISGGTGLAVLPGGAGGPDVVVCGDASIGVFRYGGNFAAGGTAIWEGTPGCGQAVPGPCDTFFANQGGTVGQYDAQTGANVGNPFPQGGASGVAAGKDGKLLVVGNAEGSGTAYGFMALVQPNGVCNERSGDCTTPACSPCVVDATIPPLWQAAALPDGTFLVSVSTAAQTQMNTVWRVDPGTLALTPYYVGPTGTNFYGLLAFPQP